MEIKMRRARMADAAAINALWAESGGIGSLEIGPRPLEFHQQWLARHDKRHPVFVGTTDGRVIWWVALSECPGGYPFDCVAVLELGIPDQINGAELTDLLLRFLEQQAIRLGYYKLLVCLDAEERSTLHIYRRMGFRDVGILRSQGYRQGKLVDIVIMERLLPTDMEALERYYTENYDFYREYFQQEHQHREEEAQGRYVLEYEEVATPEDQMPEGIVRFLRAKKTPDGRPVLHPVGEDGTPAPQDGPPVQEAPKPQLPEGIVRFLKSKKLPDGTPAHPDLPPVVPVKIPPSQRMAAAAQPDEPLPPEEEEAEAGPPPSEEALAEEPPEDDSPEQPDA